MDEQLLRSINAFASVPTIAALGAALSSRWILWLTAIPVLAVFSGQRRFVAIASIVLATGLSEATTSHVIKPLVDRPRPCRALSGLVTPDGCGPGESFPSGHAATGFGLASSTASFVPKSAIGLLPLAVFVAASRVLLGVHYPSDVTAGAFLGAFVGISIGTLGRRLERKKESRVTERGSS
ncbi:MAG: phosphatase PAP2 family protein [Deltaproteobacteria bacterium]|nr:phosphatase PAP2 family protein [Deltaproteobacteria bacterium]